MLDIKWLVFILIIIVLILVITKSTNAAAETFGGLDLVENKKKLTPSLRQIGFADFDSFLKNKVIDKRLVCIVSCDKTTRDQCAEKLNKKYGYKIIDGTDLKPPRIRDHFYIPNVIYGDPPGEQAKQRQAIELGRKKKFVITGDFKKEDLERIFKGKGYNKNFLLLFVVAKEGTALRWSKASGNEKKDFDKMVENCNKHANDLAKTYKTYKVYHTF